jgi:hypothetical protein
MAKHRTEQNFIVSFLSLLCSAPILSPAFSPGLGILGSVLFYPASNLWSCSSTLGGIRLEVELIEFLLMLCPVKEEEKPCK